MRQAKRQWQVWTEDEEGNEDEVRFISTEAQCKSYYKRNGGSRAGLHVGYIIPSDDVVKIGQGEVTQ